MKHGGTKNNRGAYQSWADMKQRCTNQNNHNYRAYGGRGIKVCDRWQDFANFLADMGDRPANMTIERANSDGDYEPTNCRWATKQEQRANQRNFNQNTGATHCRRGHAFEGDNLGLRFNGHRTCKSCKKAADAARWAARAKVR